MVMFAAGSAWRFSAFLFLALAMVSTLSVPAQTSAAGGPVASPVGSPLPQFEVATIKPLDPNVGHMVGVDVSPGGTVTLNGLTLKGMICTAFNLSAWQIEGGDAWVGRVEYNVVAKPAESAAASRTNPRHTLFEIEDEQLRQMLQSLLADRFQLRFHRETKTGQVYLLERSGKKLRLRPADDAAAGSFGSIGHTDQWGLFDTTMPQLAHFVSTYYLHRPVIDRTGLSGAFDYRSPLEDYSEYQSDPSGSLIEMIGQAGLKLVPAQGPAEYFVIDHTQPPSPN